MGLRLEYIRISSHLSLTLWGKNAHSQLIVFSPWLRFHDVRNIGLKDSSQIPVRITLSVPRSRTKSRSHREAGDETNAATAGGCLIRAYLEKKYCASRKKLLLAILWRLPQLGGVFDDMA